MSMIKDLFLIMKTVLAGLCRASAFLLLLTGCAHLGPKTVAVDRFDYSTAIADSWKQQTLLNIVKLRYMDMPVFMDVASVVSGYSMQTGVSVNGTLSSEAAVQGNFGSIGGQAIYTDRPTITYVPMTGEKFLRGLITPIDPKNVFFLLQSGYALKTPPPRRARSKPCGFIAVRISQPRPSPRCVTTTTGSGSITATCKPSARSRSSFSSSRCPTPAAPKNCP
jgi:hypothetical protein